MPARTVMGIFVAAGAVLIAAAQPIIVVQPANQTIIENGPCTFSVEATGAAPLRYQWLEWTNFATYRILPGETSSVLHFASRAYTFHGFAVVVSDATGAVTSRTARINYALRFISHPASQTVTQGVSAQLSGVGTGTVPFRYQWRFHSYPLLNETNSTLPLPGVELADSGPYRLLIHSSIGSVTSRIANLTVLPGTNAPPPPPPSFVNFETAPVHPVALSPDRSRLAVCNLPDARLEIFESTSGSPRSLGSVPVGLNPVSVRFRTSNEVWVVNHISDSVNVVDLDRMSVIGTLPTLDGPSDVVFAGDPLRAFVSCAMENAVLVFDPITRQRVAALPIDGERPKAMCVSADGRRVYVAIFESGNASTILAPIFGLKGQLAVHGTLGNTNGPYGGRNPPPNQGTNFSPAITNVPPNLPIPRDGHIVKKNAAGRWMDDNNGDWTRFVSGTNAELSGRVVGWDMPDRDVAIIDATELNTSYASGLMNLLMDIAVNPATDEFTVVGTDARNEVRFEPNLNGTFLRVNLARYHPDTQAKAVTDLNPHLDYSTSTISASERRKSIGDPRGIVWNEAGTRAYISGMGSGNLIAVDAAGNRIGEPLQLEAGACGMALDETRDVLYVLNRFANTISMVDIDEWEVDGSTAMFDPTPAVIKTGRKHLYDTHKNSGLGYVSCASCHPDGRMDRLAWDLGDPGGAVVRVNSINFHPMKGPMVTLTLQDIIGHEPFHWRGDRVGIKDFNQTFPALLGGPLLTTNEMREFKEFLATLTLPPNRHRNFDNTLSTDLPLPGHVASGRRALPAGAALPNGNARRGLDVFFQFGCANCHRLPTGLGPDLVFFNVAPLGPDGERHVNNTGLPRNSNLSFKMVQLRNLTDKMGMDLRSASSRSGFGFSFNGRMDTIARFFDFGFNPATDQQIADMVALLLSFSGSDFPTNPVPTDNVLSRDVPAAVGKQFTLDASESTITRDEALSLATVRRTRVEVVIRRSGRTWLYNRAMDQCQSDRAGEVGDLNEITRLPIAGEPLSFLIVPQGTGQRIALDRDGDGYFDGDELDVGSDPANARSIPLVARLRLSPNTVVLSWNSQAGRTYRVQFSDDLSSGWLGVGQEIVATSTNTVVTEAFNPQQVRRFYRIQAAEED